MWWIYLGKLDLDLTVRPNHWESGSMAARFRLANYYNLPGWDDFT